MKPLLFILLLFLFGCAPKIRTSITDGSLRPLAQDAEVVILDTNQAVPDSCKLIGTLKIGDNGFSVNCSYGDVMEDAKKEARKAGGNIVKMTQLQAPDFVSGCYRMKANLLYKQSFANLKPVATKSDSIQIPKHGTDFRQHGKELTMDQFDYIIRMNPDAVKEMRIAKANYKISYVIGYTGGFCLGFEAGYAIFGGKISWPVVGLGAGLIGLYVPLVIGSNKHARKAATIYNSGLK